MSTEVDWSPVIHALEVQRDNQARRRRFLTMYFSLVAIGVVITVALSVLPH